MINHKKLIEVAFPLEAINEASAREKSIRHGHPSTLHLWWARRPLAAARAVIFAQMVDDPSAHPDRFPTEEAQEQERQRLFRLIEELVKWENTTNETVLAQARDELWKSWRVTCAANKDHPRAAELFDLDKLPTFHDRFAGGGSLHLEAQRLGLEAYASDLNPVAVLICKAMIEIPPKFAGRPPVSQRRHSGRSEAETRNPEAALDSRLRGDDDLFAREWLGAQGLAEDVRYYGQWMRDEAEKRIGHLYPTIEITAEMAKVRPDLKPLVGQKLTVIAWLWARTVKSPNPAFAHVDVPLASTFMLSTKAGKEVYVEPVIPGARASEGTRASGSHSVGEDARAPRSTGWETFLDAVIGAGFGISGTWPMRTELGSRMIGRDANALAFSIVLVCRPRPANATTATRREFIAALKAELPQALAHLQRGNIAPVNLAQAAIGPGMAVYTRYAKVLDAEGKSLSVHEALALINQTLDEELAEHEDDFDADSRWALAWFEQHGFAEGEFGVAETLSKAKNTSVAGMVNAGILTSSRGKVRLLKPDELPTDWDPATDPRLTAWEIVHHLIRALDSSGEGAAAELVAKLGSKAEVARELAYRLYTVWSARSAHKRRFRTTPWFKAGRRLCACRARAASKALSKRHSSKEGHNAACPHRVSAGSNMAVCRSAPACDGRR